MKFKFKPAQPDPLMGLLYGGLYMGAFAALGLLALYALLTYPLIVAALCAGAAIGLITIYALWPWERGHISKAQWVRGMWPYRISPMWRKGMRSYAHDPYEAQALERDWNEAVEALPLREAIRAAVRDRRIGER